MTMPISNDLDLLRICMAHMVALHGLQYSIPEELVAILSIPMWFLPSNTDV